MALNGGDNQSITKREGYLEWEEYFMAASFLSAMRSKDPVTQVGACIVNKENVVVGLGYNGMPKGCSDDELPWTKHSVDKLDNKYLYVVHAEVNAITNRNTALLDGCRMYVGLFPCNECAKVIIQAGIREVIFMSDKHCAKPETIAAKRMFQMAGVAYRQFTPKQKKIVIDFDLVDWNNASQVPPTPRK